MKAEDTQDIGADATQSGDATSSQLMADDATAEAKKYRS